MKFFNSMILLCVFTCSSSVYAQLQSSYLKDPELAKNLVLNEVNFWSNYKDEINGGFYNEVSNTGTFLPTASKSFAAQSRLAYAFTRAFMLTGDVSYLALARHALIFNYKNAWDNLNGGWYYSADFDGSNPKNNIYHLGKWSYAQHYALLGCGVMNEATDGTYNFNDGQDNDQTWLYKGLNEINTKLWDNRPGLEGYYDIAKQDWSTPRDKGFTPTADAMTTHAALMALRNIDPSYKARFLTLSDRITDKIIPSSYISTSPLIYEYSNSNWVPYGNELFNGHAVKCAWQLGRAYLMEPKEIYKTKAQQVLNEVINRGYYDSTYGGIFYFKKGGQKNLWTQEQGVLAGILNSTITDDPSLKDMYLGLADGCMLFVETHMVDFSNGGSYTDVNINGSLSASYPKGDYWEAGYHLSELAYYVYLYGNVYLYNKPVELYYYFSPQATAQSHKLTPFEIADNKLMIEEVLLNDQPYTNFNAHTRTIEIPAGEGGKFKVRFGQTPSLLASGNSHAEDSDFRIYPMPITSDFLTVEGALLKIENKISVKITDMSSRVLFERSYDSAYTLEIPVTEFKPGVYFLFINNKVKTIVVGD